MMAYPELFSWWAMTISWGIVFLVVVSTYLYIGSRKSLERRRSRIGEGMLNLIRDFVFVWVLLSLLILYIVSIGNSSSILFAAGNVIIEIILFVYAIKNRTKKRQPA